MFKTYFLDVITKHYVDFKGRATRKQFWLFALWNLIFLFVFAFLGAFNGTLNTIFNTVAVIYQLAIFLPCLAMAVRRLHDIDFCGWWVLLSFIPLIGGIVLLVFYILPSKDPNRF